MGESGTCWPDVILVNGPSSAGKTTLCTTLRDQLPHPYLLVGFDDFVFMTPPRYYRGADTAAQGAAVDDPVTALGVRMISTAAPGEPPCVVAQFGSVFQAVVLAMAPAVRTLVDHGNAVIFDHVIHDAAMHQSLVDALDGLDVFAVGVTCPVEILEERERQRGDRVLGRARGLAGVVHDFMPYDVMIDTGSSAPDACANAIVAAIYAERAV